MAKVHRMIKPQKTVDSLWGIARKPRIYTVPDFFSSRSICTTVVLEFIVNQQYSDLATRAS